MPGATHAISEAAGAESALADKALAAGYRTVAAVGGDGTWSQVADRIIASGRDDVRFAALPAGTGNDFIRSLGHDHRDEEAAIRVLAGEGTLRVDVGRILTPTRPIGVPGVQPSAGRHFLNLVGFGFDIAVIDAAAQARFLRGELLYKVTALHQLFRFPGFEVDVEDAQGRQLSSGRQLMLTISNGRYFGGGFPIAPVATVTDHRLHACLIGDGRPLQRLRLFNLAERGLHVRSERVDVVDSSRFTIRFPTPPRFEVDGDVHMATGTEVEVEVLPGALTVLSSENFASQST